MERMKRNALAAICAITLVLVVIIFSLGTAMFDSSLHKKIQTDIGVTPDLQETGKQYLDAVRGGEMPAGLTAPEQEHVKDVGVLVNVLAIALILLVLLLVFLMKHLSAHDRSFVLFAGGILGVATLAIFGILFSTNGFDRVFDALHLPFFAEGSWRFGPDSLTIHVYPPAFFEKIVIGVVGFRAAIISAALLFAGAIGMRRKKR